MSSADYMRSAEWRQAEEMLSACLGYKIVYTPETFVKGVGTIPEKFERQRLDFGPKDGKPGPHVTAIAMSDRATWDLWCEAIKLRIDHAGACKLAWDLYAAATGVSKQSFNGMPAGEPAAHVREERRRLLSATSELAQKAVDRERELADLNARIDNLGLRATLDTPGDQQ